MHERAETKISHATPADGRTLNCGLGTGTNRDCCEVVCNFLFFGGDLGILMLVLI